MKTPVSVIIAEHVSSVDNHLAEHLKAIDSFLNDHSVLDHLVVDQLVELQVVINGDPVLVNMKEVKLWLNSYIDMLVVSLGGRNAS